MEEQIVEGKKPGRIAKAFDSVKQLLQNIVKEYPVTMVLIFVATLMYSIVMDIDIDEDVYLFLARVNCVLIVTAAGTLLAEQVFRSNNIIKYTLYAVSNLIAIGITMVMSSEDMSDTILEMFIRFICIYFLCIGLFTLWHMYRSNKTSFENYCISVFIRFFKTSLIYWLFAGGIALILLIFSVLIIDLDDLDIIARVEIFLAGGLYLPAVINAFAHTKEEAGKFAKVVVEYVLFTMLLAAFVIIYIYIAKLIIQWELPSNEVFAILAFLFALGLPIWTMTQNFQNQVLGKIARYMPFIYAPFIILELICICMRIGQYGITPARYLGMAYVIFQIIYVALYSIKMGKFVHNIVFVVMAMATIILVIPGVNVFSVSAVSQGKIIDEYLANGIDELTEKEKVYVKQSFNVLDYDCSIEGDKYIETHFSKSEIREINKWSSYYYNGEYRDAYYSWHTYYGANPEYDIAGYSSMKVLDVSTYDDDIDFSHFELDEKGKFYDITELVEELMEDQYECFGSQYEEPDGKNVVDLGDITIIINYINVHTVDDEVVSFNISGFILK